MEGRGEEEEETLEKKEGRNEDVCVQKEEEKQGILQR